MHEASTQEFSAAVFREVAHQFRLRGQSSACALFDATRQALQLPEEECGGEILDALCLLIRTGLAHCNTHDKAEGSIRIGGLTILTPTCPAIH